MVSGMPRRSLALAAVAMLTGTACAAHLRYRTGTPLDDVACDARDLCVASGAGVLLRSNDAGRTWHEVDSPVSVSLAHVSVMGSRVLAGGQQGALLESDDGGHSFRMADSGVAAKIVALTALDAQHVVAVAEDGEVTSSADGGRTWQPTPGLSALGQGVRVHDADWLGPLLGVLAADDLYLTTDGGKTFSRVDSRAAFPALKPSSSAGYVDWKSAGCTKPPVWVEPAPTPLAVRFFGDHRLAVALDDRRVFVSDDLGRTFHLVQTLPARPLSLRRIRGSLWGVMDDGSLARLEGPRFRSTAGATLASGSIDAVSGGSGASLVAVGRGLAASDDNGASWTKGELSLGGRLARAFYNRDPDWDHYFVPGGGAVVYEPRSGSFGGALVGWEARIALFAWSHNNENPGPAQWNISALADVFPAAHPGALAFYGFGTTLSFERSAPRRFLIPTFGLELGALHQDAIGSVFAMRPHVGLLLVNVRRLQVEVDGGYLITGARLDQLRGPFAAAAADFTLW